jgi:hypothetical protein
MIRKVVVRKINVRKTALLSALIFCIIGLVTGIADAVINGIQQGFLSPVASTGAPAFGFWSVFIFPAAGFGAGYLIGLFTAWFFNLTGKLMGGVDIEITEKPEKYVNQ